VAPAEQTELISRIRYDTALLAPIAARLEELGWNEPDP
jgi:hypothetical protein